MNEEQLKLYGALTALQKACVDIKVKNPSMSNSASYCNATGKHNLTRGGVSRLSFSVFNNPKVKAFLKSLEIETVDDLIMTREQMMQDLTDIINTSLDDVSDMIHNDDTVMNTDTGELYTGLTSMTVKKFSDIPDHAKKSIKSIKQGRYGIEITLYDTNEARKQLAAMQGFNAPTKTELSGPDGGPIEQVQLTADQLVLLNKDLEDEF